MIIIISIYISLLGALLFLLYRAKKLNDNDKLYKEEKRKREGGVK